MLLRVLCCNHRGDMGRKKMTPFAKAKKLQKRMEASLPSALQEELGTTTVTDSSPPEIVETQHSSAAHSVNSITTRQRNWSSHVFIHGKTYVTSQLARTGHGHPGAVTHLCACIILLILLTAARAALLLLEGSAPLMARWGGSFNP